MALKVPYRACLKRQRLDVSTRHFFPNIRTASTSAAAAQKQEGDISAAFASLSGLSFEPLEPRFADVKRRLITGNEAAVHDSWTRLLHNLREEIAEIRELGSTIVPEIDFKDIQNPSEAFVSAHRKRGVAVIRNVMPQEEALDLKRELRAYIQANPSTKAFPADNPQVYELYWSPSQMRARGHPNMIAAQRFLMNFWHSTDPNALVSTDHPTSYADRLRMRLPGDAKFALGPHVDGGSCERWEQEGYGKGKVYDAIWHGDWESFDPWESNTRLSVNSDLYNGVGACSMFRMFQGWLSMSNTGPYEGTLLVNPLFNKATAYFLLRPFFAPKQQPAACSPDAFLHPDNWHLDLSPTNSWLHGATPGRGQELRPELHPHLDLAQSMVHMPRVNPGDYVSWHCDTIHAVDSVHAGKSDSSVMYIPACPLTLDNAAFLARQRECFLQGTPCPDFGSGKGESEHVGRPGVEDVRAVIPEEGMRAFGLQEWDGDASSLTSAQKELVNRANKMLGFYE